MNFTDFQFHHRITAGIAAAGYYTPTPIQMQAIPLIMQDQDLIGLAQTGTGKTAAYLLPLLNRLIQKTSRDVRALVIAPTRELVEQIYENIHTLAGQSRLRGLTLYGGVGITPQIQKLKRGADILVACPGRLLDHLRRGNLDFSSLEVLVLDEADQMLDMGFIPDIRKILTHVPRNRQTLMFSATMRQDIRQLADEMLRHPVTAQVDHPAPADTVSHIHFPVPQELKTPLLLKILQDTPIASVLVFTRTKHRAKRLSEILLNAGYGSTSLQGNLSQNRRKEAMDGFRSGKFQILVATDIAARGIDVSGVSHVVNYDVPDTAEAYIHRIGRTGRVARRGEAFNLVTHEDRGLLQSIDSLLGASVERRVFADFDYRCARPAELSRGFSSTRSRRLPSRPTRTQ